MDTTEDTLALYQLQARYGHVMDDRDWEGLNAVFTDDAVVDFQPFGLPRMEGLEAIVRDFKWIRHPYGHHVTNILVDVDGDTARMRSKILAVLDDGTSITGQYLDEARRTSDGWRLTYRLGKPFPRRPKKESD
ncbi:MAG TPA: nuclear transport factor 2 family protein [Acidimicrobiia bacterium]|nr:nuclear transport factor 2 family protein [Acidimicrobiia bacterium]